MPIFFMPAKDPDEVRTFFGDLVEQGKMKLTLATERPDVYDRLEPTEEVRLVVDRADTNPPEGANFDKILPEFRPTPLPEDQLASWSDEKPAPEETETDSSEDEPPAAEARAEESAELAPAVGTHAEGGVLDQKWTPFTNRGFKG